MSPSSNPRAQRNFNTGRSRSGDRGTRSADGSRQQIGGLKNSRRAPRVDASDLSPTAWCGVCATRVCRARPYPGCMIFVRNAGKFAESPVPTGGLGGGWVGVSRAREPSDVWSWQTSRATGCRAREPNADERAPCLAPTGFPAPEPNVDQRAPCPMPPAYRVSRTREPKRTPRERPIMNCVEPSRIPSRTTDRELRRDS